MKPVNSCTEGNVSTLDKLEKLVAAGFTFDEAKAYEAGRNCGYHGPSEANCNFAYFRTAAMKDAWELGKKQGTAEKFLP